MKKYSIWDILIWVFSAELVGALSALFTGNFTDFFMENEIPPLMPPTWLFPVVWVILYAIMGFSAYLVHSAPVSDARKSPALAVYWLQLAINFSWSIIFFRVGLLWVGAAVAVVLLIAIIVMTGMFAKITPTAGYLNIPYVLWLIFAVYLAVALAVVNL